MSGNVVADTYDAAATSASSSTPGRGRELEALRLEPFRRFAPPDLARRCDVARREDDAVHDDGEKEPLDVRTRVTNSRPESSAHARAERSSDREPRTDAPMATPSASRVARTSRIAQRRSSGSM